MSGPVHSTSKARPIRAIGRGRHVLTLALALWLPACVNWSHAQAPLPQTLAPSRQVKVWSSERTWRLHAVEWTGDSLVGVPFQSPPKCDTCRVAIPLAEVDSLKTGASPETLSMVLLVGLPIAIITVGALLWAGSGMD